MFGMVFIGNMICDMKIIGIFHICHSFLLTIYPYVYDYDVEYVNYYMWILLSYTYLNAECPISYVYKKIKDPLYIAGTTLTSFDDMYAIAPKEYVDIYVFIMSCLSTSSLFMVLIRLKTPFISIGTNGIIVLYYIILSRYSGSGSNIRTYFMYYQWVLRMYLIYCICFIMQTSPSFPTSQITRHYIPYFRSVCIYQSV